jgi:hypothetical protein
LMLTHPRARPRAKAIRGAAASMGVQAPEALTQSRPRERRNLRSPLPSPHEFLCFRALRQGASAMPFPPSDCPPNREIPYRPKPAFWKRLRMSALGQKRTYAVRNGMSALLPIATAKADFRTRSCPLYPQSGHVRCN